MDRDSIVKLLESHKNLSSEVERLRLYVAWIHRQLFGQKSERRVIDPNNKQLTLGEWLRDDADEGNDQVVVPEHRRRRKAVREDEDSEHLRFDESVPVEEIRLPNPEIDEADETQEITEKVTYRLGQRPASYVVLKYIRPVIKRKDGSISCPPSPPAVFGRCMATSTKWPFRLLPLDRVRWCARSWANIVVY